MKKYFLVFASLCLLGLAGYAQIIIPSGFTETIPPKPGTKEWYSLNNSNKNFGVKIVDKQLEVKKVNEIHKCELTIFGGKLIGIDNGEWGGELLFNPTDSTKKAIPIINGNIKFLFRFKSKIYFMEGLAHLSISEGALYELDTVNYSFTYKKILDFEDAPEAYTVYHDKILVVTFENFYAVQDFKMDTIFKDTFWSCLYPNSIAVSDERNVFVGIRGGIVRLDLEAKTMRFYKK